jgi:hypothetical protein
MTKKILLISAMLFLIVGIAQAQRKSVPRKAAVQAKTATGLLYFVDSGQGTQTCLLKTPEGILEVSVTKKTRVVNFPADNSAWNLGAEWRITYHESKDYSGFEVDTVTFTGKIVPAIADAENAARDYNDALSGDDKDYKTAYSKLSEAARRNLSFGDFTKMYKDVEGITSAVRVCSYSDEKVVMLLTFYGVSSDDRFQTVEIVQNGGKYAINRLFNLQKSEEETACQ